MSTIKTSSKSFAQILIAIFFLLPLNFWAIDFLPKASVASEFPNPYSLKINWWDYYDVDAATLKNRIQTTKTYYQKLEEALSQNQKVEAAPYFNRILKGLEILEELKEKNDVFLEPTIPSKKELYTFDSWLSLSSQMLKEKEKLEYLSLRQNLALSGYKSSSQAVDTLFKTYVNQTESDPNRLIQGLSVIQGRIFVAIEKAQVDQLEALSEKQQNNIDQLQEKIQNSYTQIDFSSANLDELEKKLDAATRKEKAAKNEYIEAYETSPTKDLSVLDLTSELTDEKLLNAKLEYEIAQVQKVNLEIQSLIISWAKKQQDFSSKDYKTTVEKWKRQVEEIRSEIPSSESSSELILQQSLKSLALQNSQGYMSNQSLDLAEKAILKIEELKNALYVNDFLTSQLDTLRRKYHFSPLDWISSSLNGFLGFFSSGTWFNQSIFKIGEYPVTVWALIKFFLIIIISVFLGKFVRYYIHSLGRKQRRIRMASIYILSRISHYLIVILGISIAGYIIGLDLTIFAYVAGALAIWVGFSLQSIFHNFISGIIVLITKTIRMNDIIELDSGEIGTVVDLNLRTTVIRTYDGKDVIIPNADIVNKKFQNLSLSSHTLRIQVPFRVGLKEDKEKISKLIIEAAKKVEITSDVNEPEIWFTGYGQNFLSMELVVWVNTLLRGKSASRSSQYYWAIDDTLRENGIEIPIPLQNIHLEKEKEDYPIGAAVPIPVQPKEKKPPETF